MHFGHANIARHAPLFIEKLTAAQAAIAAMPPVSPSAAFIGLEVTGLEALKLSIRGVASVVTVDPAVVAAEAAAALAEENARVAAAAAAAEQARVAAAQAEVKKKRSFLATPFPAHSFPSSLLRRLNALLPRKQWHGAFQLGSW